MNKKCEDNIDEIIKLDEIQTEGKHLLMLARRHFFFVCGHKPGFDISGVERNE